MQFYYNSGIPQRQRRTRDGRTSSVNRCASPRARHVPCRDGQDATPFCSSLSAAVSQGAAVLGARRGGCARGPEQRTCPGQIRWHVHVPQRANRAPSKLRAVWPHRDVPSFLQYPDGSHSLGVITPVGAREEEEEAGAGNQSGTITGSFVVWADPSATPGMPPCCCCAPSVRPFARAVGAHCRVPCAHAPPFVRAAAPFPSAASPALCATLFLS